MKITIALLLMPCAMFFFSACTILPPAPLHNPEYSLPPAQTGKLAEISQQVFQQMAANESAYLLLSRNDDALNWRLALADHATTSIDAQYFIWQGDEASTLLFDRLLRAADRGVRVRLLVDDLWLVANDKNIAAISQHPNFEIRLYNPGYARHKVGGLLEFFAKFQELNRRMHNKLYIVDNRFAIVGGRNIGNPYFGLSKKYNFRDLDVLTIGPVVEEISSAYDEYWNAELAYPGQLLSDKATENDILKLREFLKDFLKDNQTLLASYPLEPRDWSGEMNQMTRLLTTGEGHFLQDDPILVDDEQIKLVDMIDTLSTPSHEEIILVSPYFIPVKGLMEDMKRVQQEGVQVRILTASLASNNHTIAHSHYKKYRRRILDTGAELFEFSPSPSPNVLSQTNVPPVEADFIALHVKALVGDRQRCFIGSLNLDPRAIEINTENGLYIESSELAEQLADTFDMLMLPENAWQVHLENETRTLTWKAGDEIRTSQPARSFGQRIADFFYRWIPVESQL